MIMQWPNQIPAGVTFDDAVVSHIDVFPTVLESVDAAERVFRAGGFKGRGDANDSDDRTNSSNAAVREPLSSHFTDNNAASSSYATDASYNAQLQQHIVCSRSGPAAKYFGAVEAAVDGMDVLGAVLHKARVRCVASSTAAADSSSSSVP